MMFSEVTPHALLYGMEEVRHAILNPEQVLINPTSSMKVDQPVKSDWMIALIGECTDANGSAYNDTVEKAAAERLGMEVNQHIKWLVYFNQSFRRHDLLVAEGWRPFTQELIEQAWNEGMSIALKSQDYIVIHGAEAPGYFIYPVKEIGGKHYAVPPRSRNKYLPPNARTPAKLVPGPKRPKEKSYFKKRVDDAVRFILKEQTHNRELDDAFENFDGDQVATAIVRRARKNPNLDRIIREQFSTDECDWYKIAALRDDLTDEQLEQEADAVRKFQKSLVVDAV